jgi:hypothetical protein
MPWITVIQTGLWVVPARSRFVWLEYLFRVWYDGTYVEDHFHYLLLIQLPLLVLLGQVLCVCVILVSHIPAGPLRLGVGLPKQLMALLRLPAPGLTSSAAPVWTGCDPVGSSPKTKLCNGLELNFEPAGSQITGETSVSRTLPRILH